MNQTKKSPLGWRVPAMGLTLLSLLGPWVFEVVNVPAQ